jgi:cell pole-organizing protein PopZ
VDLAQIKVESGNRLPAQAFTQHLGGDEGIAVAVATDPRADPEEVGQCPLLARKGLPKLVFELAVEARQFNEESLVEVADAVLDLVDHRQARRTHHARPPQRQHRTAQGDLVVGEFARRQAQPIAVVEQAPDFVLTEENALATDLGRMGGQHWRDQRLFEAGAQAFGVNAGGLQAGQRQLQAAVACG